MAGGDANKPKEQIVDFDKADVNDELAGVEYVDELYKFYELEEVITYLLSPTHICLLGFSIYTFP